MTKSKKKQRPLLDIIILTAGQFELLDECLEALPEACGNVPYNVIIWDNASPQAERVKYYKTISPDILVIQHGQNIGYPRANTMAFRKGQAPLVLFLNDDVRMLAGSIELMVKKLDDPSIGVVGAKLIFPEDSPHPNNVGGKIQHVGLTTNIRGAFYHIFLGWNPDNPRANAVEDIMAVTGACLMTRRNLFSKVGGFAADYGMGTYEDVDYCLSILSAEKRVVVETDAVGYHHTGATIIAKKASFPLQKNESILKARWGGKYPWAEWVHW